MNIKNIFAKTSASVLALALIVTLLVPTMIGCSGQSTAAIIVSTLGSTLSAVETLEGNSTLGTTIGTDFNAVSSAISTWVPGTPTQDITQALNIVVKDINLIPVASNSTDQQLIVLAVSEIDQLLGLYSTPTITPAVGLHFGVVPHLVKTTSVSNKALKNIQNDFKTKANEIISRDKTRSFLKIK